MRKVHFFNYPHVYLEQRNKYLEIFDHMASQGAFIMQQELAKFEQALAKFAGSKYAIGVSNATDALQMLLIAGGIRPGDEVLFCSHTMIATASAIHFSGGTPIPVDTAKDHLICIDSIKQNISDKTKAIVVTQLNGRVANMDAIEQIAHNHNLQIYEDSAQALGAKFKGQQAGSFGIGGCISFYPAKNLGCFGDGGAVLCNDPLIFEKIMLLRDHGRSQNGEVEIWGFNNRLDNIQAGILLHRLSQYQSIIERRRELAFLYNEYLSNVAEIILPPKPATFPHFDVYQNFEIEAENRDLLMAFLKEKGIGTIIQWGGYAVHQFKNLGFTQSLSQTEQLFKKILMLPLNMSMSDMDVKYVSNCIKQYYSR